MTSNLEIRLENVERQVNELLGLREAVTSLGTQISQLRAEMHTGFAAIRDEVRVGDDETRHQMRVLYENLVERIKTLGEGRPGRRR